jgi:hypothetical protein
MAVRLLGAVLATIAGVVAFEPVGAHLASATSNGYFSIGPVSFTSRAPRQYFSPVLTPGVQSKDAVAIVNDTRGPITLDLYAADAKTTKTGGFTVEPNFKPKVAMGAWIHLQTSVVTVPSGGGKVVPFTYTPPANATPGDHAAGIVAAESAPEKVKGKNGVSIEAIEAVGVPVYGRVKGALNPHLAVSSVAIRVTRSLASQFGGPVDATVRYSITNTGNENLSPTVTVSLSTLTGGPPTQHVKVARILPGSTVTLFHRFDGVDPFGYLKATVVVHGGGTQATGSSTVVVLPWGLLGIVVIVLLVGFLVVRAVRRRPRRGPGEDSGEGEDTDEESTPAAVSAESTSDSEDKPANSRWW